ncbi:TIGR02281 family clan AA aspartic protease [Aliiroseovarius subalbicans]|uniref:retropepsin-like aspartic protease family protein n=1 Tax=Aliiroseovarius subalbicans TaxID=2925840 RepID=UPI001F56B35B|nr:TIGR02281 family clan AA aspartic protease [Aliiroseovarius subalbicans]MCI2398167.1 TIGR02281 family clan AA aspartic protease [Aliiroseovarius subalbicans]
MSGDDFGHLTYLILLGAAIAGYFIAENRQSLGKTTRQLIVWGLLFLGVIAGYGLWGDIRHQIAPRQSVAGSGQITVPRGFDGHFYLVLRMNDTPVNFVVDTGASEVVLTLDDARRIGLDPAALTYTGRAFTANGEVRTAPARVAQVSLSGIRDENLRVSVNEGDMDISLLGMSYLRRFEKIEISDDTLTLSR